MTLHPQAISLIPSETERVVRAAFPNGSPIIRIRDELGMRFADRDFTARFPNVGHLAMRPSRLMLVTVFPFLEGLGDRQAVDAVRRCIDWKYALALELTDPGFPFSVLQECRDRLIVAHHPRVQRAPGAVAGVEYVQTEGPRPLLGEERTVGALVKLVVEMACLGEGLAELAHPFADHHSHTARSQGRHAGARVLVERALRVQQPVGQGRRRAAPLARGDLGLSEGGVECALAARDAVHGGGGPRTAPPALSAAGAMGAAPTRLTKSSA